MADDTSSPDVLNSTAQGQLRSIIERVEHMEAEKAEVAAQIKEVFAEAKGNGFVPKIIRKVIALRKQDRAKRQEEEAILDLYLSAIGEGPLFERAAPVSRDDDTRVTISGPGFGPVETTLGGMKAAADALATPKLAAKTMAAIVFARQNGGVVAVTGEHGAGALAAIRLGLAERVEGNAELNLRGQDEADARIAELRRA